MKTLSALLLIISTAFCASDTTQPNNPTIPVTAATVTAPFTIIGGVLSQPATTSLKDGGLAILPFTITTEGEYIVTAIVNAPSDGANSFFVNIDARPEDPAMIWDIEKAPDFRECTVSWRGTGDMDLAEFSPKVFKLSAGEHRLFVVGREPAQLKSFSITRLTRPATDTIASLQQLDLQSDQSYQLEMRKIASTPEAKTRERELSAKRYDEQAALLMAGVKIAEAHPNSSTGVEALEWVLNILQSQNVPAGPAALALMKEQYATEPRIGPAIARLSYYFPDPREASYPGAVALLDAVLSTNPDRTARGQAALGLAWLAKREFQNAEAKGDPAPIAKNFKAAVQAFESVVRDYGDCPNLRTRGVAAVKATLADEARGELFEIHNLSIGKSAPEIEGEDLDGVRMKLSDHRGKVVLLVFWASWCGPCMAAVPHEKELVERFKGRPFVLVGIDGDDVRKTANQAVKNNAIPWRSFWNGPKGPAGPIAVAWNVRGWPTLYILDQNGIIREKYRRGPLLDSVLEKLVAEAEQPAKKTAE